MKSVIDYTDIMNIIINTVDRKNNFADMIDWDVLKHLNCIEIDLHSDMIQTRVFHFQKLFEKVDERLKTDLTMNINEIHQQYCYTSDSAVCYFIIYIDE